MTAGDYTLDLVIDAWSVTLSKGDIVDPASDAIALDPLNASWSLSGPYPSQPVPTSVTFALYVPDILTGPTPVQGSRVEVTITTPDHDPLAVGIAPVLEFVGLITDVDAVRLRDGLKFNIIAADHRSSIGEEKIRNEVWPAEYARDRLQRIIAASAFPFEISTEVSDTLALYGPGPEVAAATDVSPQSTAQLLDDLLKIMVVWMGYAPHIFHGNVNWQFWQPGLGTWCRLVVGQSVDAGGNVTLPIVFLPAGGPDVDAMLPYTLALTGGSLQLVRKAITPDTSQVCWIPSSAIATDSVTWRQDKATNTNRVRLTAPNLLTRGHLDSGSMTVDFADLVNTYGPNETSVAFDTDQSYVYAFTADLAWALLGTHYDASPRWSLDTFTIIAEQIADGDQWPRLFSPREHTHVYDQAVGRFVLITDIAEKWNLHDRPDYFGRLAGATLNLTKGKIRWTATLAHRLPVGVGVENQLQVFPDNTLPDPTHHAITYAELAAGPNPTYAQAGDLTYADLELVEG